MREAAKARAIAAHGGGGGFDLRETRDQLADRNARFRGFSHYPVRLA